ncbi:MAG: sensor histidine kinase [Candidatus Polarisedimenticolia bacterium]
MPRTLHETPSTTIPSPGLPDVARAFGHDLREQLGLLSVYTQLIRRRAADRLEPEADRLLDQSVAAIGQVERLVRDLVAYLRIGAVPPLGAAAGGDEALRRAVSELAPVIERTAAVIRHQPLPTVAVDPSHLEEILQRLLDNALKFRGDAPPLILVAATRRGRMAAFRVQDNGMGIDRRHLAQIFLPLKRLHGFAYEGTGMGLAFCQALVGLYGGSIDAESAPGQGSTFTFTLPLPPEAS